MDKNTVSKIHKYIDKKYSQNTDSDKDTIIKDALNRVVSKELGSFEISEKEIVVEGITERALNNKDEDVTNYDVVEVCTERVQFQDQSFEVIENWISKNVDEPIEDIREVLVDIQDIKILQYEPCVENKTHEEELVYTAPEKLEETAEKKSYIRTLMSRVNPKMGYTISKVAFFGAMILAFVLLNYKENVGMAETNSHAAQEAYKKEMLEVYNEYSEAVNGEKVDYDILACHPFLPKYFDYLEVDEVKLKEYLNKRNSLLTEDRYFYDIIKSAKEFNLNPLILFAITGQEQGFVPRTDRDAEKIANNPFNVFVSWKHYNKDLKDSSEIASRTVINLAKGNENNMNVFKWINRLYADDPHWYKGVEHLFWDMMDFCNIKQKR